MIRGIDCWCWLIPLTAERTSIDVVLDTIRFRQAKQSSEVFEVFLYPQDLLQIPPTVNAVLGGNIGGSFPINSQMWIFYLLVWLQKYVPLWPRRTLVPNKVSTATAAQPVEAVS